MTPARHVVSAAAGPGRGRQRDDRYRSRFSPAFDIPLTAGNRGLDNAAGAFAAGDLEDALRRNVSGEVRFDAVSRMLYSTDASNYQIEPVGVVIPSTQRRRPRRHRARRRPRRPLAPPRRRLVPRRPDRRRRPRHRLLESTSTASSTSTPRRGPSPSSPASTSTRSTASCKPNGLMFGPDPSSANRATAGGVVGNNSTGSHSILYGMTGDNVHSAASPSPIDGVRSTSAPIAPPTMAGRAACDDAKGRLFAKLLAFRATLPRPDRPRLPAPLAPRHRLLPRRVAQTGRRSSIPPASSSPPKAPSPPLLEITFNLVPRPARTGLVLLQFDELVASMAATPAILETEPSAVELMDRMLVNLTRSQPGYASQIAIIEGDPAAVLVVEFYGESDAELAARSRPPRSPPLAPRHPHCRRPAARPRSQAAGRRLVRAQGRPRSPHERPRRPQADPRHRGRLRPRRAPRRVRRRHRGAGRRPRHDRRLLRPRLRRLPPHPPPDQPQDRLHGVRGDGGDGPRRRRAGPPLRRRHVRRARRRPAALRAQRAHLRPRALRGHARVQGASSTRAG